MNTPAKKSSRYAAHEAFAWQWVPTFTAAKKLAASYGHGDDFDAQSKAMKRAINYFLHKAGASYSEAVRLAKAYIAAERKQLKARNLPVPKWLQE